MALISVGSITKDKKSKKQELSRSLTLALLFVGFNTKDKKSKKQEMAVYLSKDVLDDDDDDDDSEASKILAKLGGLYVRSNSTEDYLRVDLTPAVCRQKKPPYCFYAKLALTSGAVYKLHKYRMPAGFIPELTLEALNMRLRGECTRDLREEDLLQFLGELRDVCQCAVLREQQFEELKQPSAVLPHLHSHVTIISSRKVELQLVIQGAEDPRYTMVVTLLVAYNWDEVRPSRVEAFSQGQSVVSGGYRRYILVL
uniref:Uncharacterized protein n=1 Tax=Timema shepardi TaxID=629360 RepID=A0A7R9G5R4_TIMSH|nr:unnamed protein product [Timema shepardi]